MRWVTHYAHLGLYQLYPMNIQRGILGDPVVNSVEVRKNRLNWVLANKMTIIMLANTQFNLFSINVEIIIIIILVNTI